MENPRTGFYRRLVDQIITDKDCTVLVVAAGGTDKGVFESLGFKTVTFSNVDEHSGGVRDFAPFPFSQQDAEALSFDDRSFDWVVIHAALHHCHSPHRALLEMYRVARNGVLAFESRDSALMRLLERTGLTQSYEHSAVYLNGGETGGVRNGPVPNYIYRWTEREVQKAIDCYAPHAVHHYDYRYGHDSPAWLQVPGRSAKKTLLSVLYWIYRRVASLFPRQQNLFAFAVTKTQQLQPWVRIENNRPRFDMAWGRKMFGNAFEGTAQ